MTLELSDCRAMILPSSDAFAPWTAELIIGLLGSVEANDE